MNPPATLSPRAEANQLRQLLWYPDQFPVEPAEIASKLGIQVVVVALRDNISGALVSSEDLPPTILLSKSDSESRRRFTCAHELGHYVVRYRVAPEAEHYQFVDFRDTVNSSKGTDPSEIFANRFAAELLVPEERLRLLFADDPNPFSLAPCFGVSPDVIQYRLKDLRISAPLPA